MNPEIREETVDLQYKGLRLIQNDKVLKFGTDAVLLASFITVKKGETLVDFCTGSGIIPVLLSKRAEGSFLGVEIQDDAYELAERNKQLNNLENVRFIHDDLKNIKKYVDTVDVVSVNPPYDKVGSGEMKDDEYMQVAFYEVKTDLETIVKTAASILSTGGRFYMIHRSYRLAEIMDVLREYRLEPKEVRPIVKKWDAEPRYILVKAIKDGKEGMRLLPNLVVYKDDGTYTDELNRIYHIEAEN